MQHVDDINMPERRILFVDYIMLAGGMDDFD